VATSRKS